MRTKLLTFYVNGEVRRQRVPVHRTLLEVLREDQGLTGTKHGCELGECGACTVLINGRPRLSCITLAIDAEGAEVMTVEGLAGDGRMNPLQVAFAELGIVQCGYCTPGVLLSAYALLRQTVAPSTEEVKMALSGSICRCSGYSKMADAVILAGKRMGAGRK